MYTGYPFYSLNRGIGVDDVYHSHPACQIAQSIPVTLRLAGNPLAWPECVCCAVHHASQPTSRPVHTLHVTSPPDLS